MNNVIQFRTKAAYPTGTREQEPTFTITVYDNLGDAGFQWYCNSDEPIGPERLQNYVGDMFLSMLPDEADRPGILRSVRKFVPRIFNPTGNDR